MQVENFFDYAHRVLSEPIFRDDKDSYRDALAGTTNEGITSYCDIEDALHLYSPVKVFVWSQDESSSNTFVRSSSPLVIAVCRIAENLSDDDAFNSPVEEQILRDQCQLIVSFPDKLASKRFNSSGDGGLFSFNATLYWERLIDSVLLLAFSTPEVHASVGKESDCNFGTLQLEKVLTIFARCFCHRGLLTTLSKRLFVLADHYFTSALFPPRMEMLVFAVGDVSVCRRVVARKRMDEIPAFSIPSLLSSACQLWILSLLENITEKRTELKAPFCIFWVKLLTFYLAAPLNVDDWYKSKKIQLGKSLSRTFFIELTTSHATSRNVLRMIFVDVLGNIPINRGTCKGMSDVEEDICYAIISKWGDEMISKSHTLEVNTALAHSVIYTLMYIKREHNDMKQLPSRLLSPLLNGISQRMESVRYEVFRRQAMTVSAAFASLFVSGSEATDNFLKEETVALPWQEWLNGETALADVEMPHRDDATDHPTQKLCLVRRETCKTDFPLDPDSSFAYFVFREDLDVVLKERNSPLFISGSDSLALPESTSTLPSFGLQQLMSDELDGNVEILTTFRQCYNALLGIGRGPNAQLYEVQDAIESSLRGLSKCLSLLVESFSGTVDFKVTGELSPMLSSLIPTLVGLSIHAPEERLSHLLKLKHTILVHLIVLVPKLSLYHFSLLIYSSQYGVYQRVEMVQAVGEAAKILSGAVVKSNHRGEGMIKSANAISGQKRIYPPIPASHNSQSVAVVVSEGRNTRRWGTAVVERAAARNAVEVCTNTLGHYAFAFVAALLSKQDEDHFKFFQDSDPYTPAEVLRSLIVVFQSIRSVRHIASDLCSQHFDFFVSVILHHPHPSIQKEGWLAMGEVMCCWCGAAPMYVVEKDEQGAPSLHYGWDPCASLIFSERWLASLDVLTSICEQQVRNLSECSRVGVLVVSRIRDLVVGQQDINTMVKGVVEKYLV